MKFILTKELGRLARWLRILGYDSIYYDKDDKSKLIITSLRDERIILTRDSKMSRYSGVRMARIIEEKVEKQLGQVIREFKLEVSEEKTFLRCVECNEILTNIDKERVRGKVPDYVFETQNEFKTCLACNKVFWQGTHWNLVKKFLKNINAECR